MEDLVLYIILFLIIFGFFFDQVLTMASNKGWKKKIPVIVKDYYSEEEYHRAKNYHIDKERLSLIKQIFSLVLIIAILISGFFGILDEYITKYFTNEFMRMLAFFGVLFFASDLLSLPFQYISTFKIEERYGFNKTTLGTFFIDKIKSYLLAIILGGLVLYVVYSIYKAYSDEFWILAWAVISVISIFMAMFYTKLLLPVFNKLRPLEDGELKVAIEEFADKAGFEIKKISVMDASKRTTKANAFFSGLGRTKSIVLYDTLIEQHSTEELLAILAHEIGHYKLKHIPVSMILSLSQSLLTFFILGLFLSEPLFTRAIGFEEHSFYASLIAFSLLYSPVELILSIFSNLLSRKNEYQADNFAAKYGLAQGLVIALIKMSAHHLSNLYPGKWEVFISYSHPTLMQRITNLNFNENESISTSTGLRSE